MNLLKNFWSFLLSGITVLTTLLALERYWNSSWRYVLLVAVCLSVGYLVWKIVGFLGNTFTPCRRLGIRSIHYAGGHGWKNFVSNVFAGNQGKLPERIRPYLENGKHFRCLHVTGQRLFFEIQPQLEQFLAREDAQATIILCHPQSEFIEETVAAIGRLQAIIDGVHARIRDSGGKHGTLTFGFADTQCRNAVTTCDAFGWITLSLPPLPDADGVSLELTGDAEDAREGAENRRRLLAQANRHVDHVGRSIKAIRWLPTDTVKMNLFDEITKAYGLNLGKSVLSNHHDAKPGIIAP